MALVYIYEDGPAQTRLELLTQNRDVTRPRMLTLDTTLVLNASGVAGATLTDALNTLQSSAQLGTVVSQIGWNPALGSSVLQLLPAGHTAGMYIVAFALVVRTNLGNSPNATLGSWTSPNKGVDSEVMSESIAQLPTGLILANDANAIAMHRVIVLMSTGATALTLTLSNGTSGLADVYGCARLFAL
jgi:hypothetical protein